MNVLAICAGIGGLELGLDLASGGRARAVGYVERDAYAASVLLARMEDEALERAPIWDDLTTFDAGRWRGVVDLVSAGFPCQPWSVAGKRKGTEDDRWIWPAIVRIVRECGAPLVFLENVPGLLRHGLREVLSDLAQIGFNAEWTCVAAADVGAPHRRERLFILAWRVSDSGGDTLRLLAERRPGAARPAHEGHAEPGDLGQDVADPEHEGRAGRPVLRRRLDGRGRPGPQRLAFPPGPGDAAGWERWLAAGGPAPAESGLRGSVDGLSPRMERLQTLGNGVVPAQAARAFRLLCERLA